MENLSREILLENEKISEKLIRQISNITLNNGVIESDIKALDYNITNIKIIINIIWLFYTSTTETSKAGGSYEGEICSSKYDVDRIISKITNEVKTNKNLRNSFIEEIHSYGREGLLITNNTHLIKDYGKFSFKENCRICNGKGKKSCNSCGGRKTHRCGYCRGKGSFEETRYNSYTKKTEYYTTYCRSCNGRGETNCNVCSGRGEITCNNCSGYGYFIFTSHVVAKTKAKFEALIVSELLKEELENFLNSKEILFIYNHVYLELFKHLSNGSSEIFAYIGDSLILNQNFSIKSKTYNCSAFSNNPHPFIRPAIFDDLLEKEVNNILEKFSNKKDLTKKEAFNSFSSLVNYPIIDISIKEIAKNKENTKIEAIVYNNAQGFISNKTAKIISNHLNKIIEKISPSQSTFIWIIGLVFLLFYGFTFTEYSIEQKGLELIVDSIFSYIIFTLILIVLIFPINLLIVLYKRSKIPKEYRQSIKIIKPIKNFIKKSCFIFIFTSGLGFLANYNYIPKTNGKIQYKLFTTMINECMSLKIKGYDICSEIDLFKTPINKNKTHL